MSFQSFFAITIVIYILGGCTATPPKSTRVSHDPILAQRGGALLMVDACIKRDELGESGDYFVIAESESGAQVALEALRKYVKNSGIPIRAELIPFVCGARHNTTDLSIRAADRLGGTERDDSQPLAVSETISSDLQYVNALGVVSTFISENGVASSRSTPSDSDEDSQNDVAPNSVSVEDFQVAASIVKAKTQASSILYLGVRGVSRSAGLATVQAIGSIVVGTLTALVTAVPASDYYYGFLPEFQIDGMLMKGALINLETNQLSWSNVVLVRGDPIEKPELMANPQALHMLYHNIVFEKTPVQPKPASN